MKQIIEMPVSIGDTVFFRFRWDDEDNSLHVGTVSSIHISINQKGVCTKSFRVSYKYDPGYKMTYDWNVEDIGTYVFFTRKGAEAAEVCNND